MQLWVIPEKMNIKPRYDQKTFRIEEQPNQWHTVVAPDADDALWINQDAYFSLMKTDQAADVQYSLKKPGHGVYFFMIEGGFRTHEMELSKRDAVGTYDTEQVNMNVAAGSYILAVEVPM